MEQLWQSIPIGRENAITYPQLCALWHCSERQVRKILHQLSYYDNNDNYVLIRSSHGKGFYKTDNPIEIQIYITECSNRAMSIFSTLKKARKVLKRMEY